MAREALHVDNLTACFTLRGIRLISSSWLALVQASGRKLGKIYYRNDPVKYDLNFIFPW